MNRFKMTQKTTYILALLFGLALSCTSTSSDNVKEILQKNDTADAKRDSIAKADSLQFIQFILDNGLNRIDTLSVGDVNGDGKKDKAFIQPFFHNSQTDSQYVNITFTCEIPAIKHYNGFSGLIANVGDLDGNKTDEIIYYPSWYQSNEAAIYIYGYSKRKWKLFATGWIRRDLIAKASDPILFLKSRVKKIDNKSFKLTHHIWRDDDIIDSTGTVIIK